MNAAFDAMSKPVDAYGGRVIRLLGGGLLAIFGAPTAHENDPQRAVMAALAMLRAIRHVKADGAGPRMPLEIRIGINTRLAIVGTIGHGMPRTTRPWAMR